MSYHLRTGLAFFLTAGLFAACDTHHHYEGAHQHGVVTVFIAVDGPSDLTVDLRGPAESFYGFEHEPTNPEEQAAQDAALSKLRDQFTDLFIFPADSHCQVSQHEVVVEMPAADDHDHENETSAEHAEHSGEHREVHGIYAVQCQGVLEGKTLAIALTEHFTRIETVNVQLLGSREQRGFDFDGRGEIEL